MKQFLTALNAIVAVAVIGLYVLHFNESPSVPKRNLEDSKLSVAYVKVDSVIFNYTLAQDLNAEIAKKQQEFSGQFEIKKNSFQTQLNTFQVKYRNGGFSSQDVAKSESERIAALETELKKMEYEFTLELQEMQAEINKQVVDSLRSTIKKYNAVNNYSYIIDASSVLEGSEGYNVTGDILKLINQGVE